MVPVNDSRRFPSTNKETCLYEETDVNYNDGNDSDQPYQTTQFYLGDQIDSNGDLADHDDRDSFATANVGADIRLYIDICCVTV